jgi:hypothetical protein
MSVLKRLSGVFKTGKSNPPPAAPAAPPPEPAGPEPKTHRERLKQRQTTRDDDIAARFATAFEALDQTASAGTEMVRELSASLADESDKLKRALSVPKPRAQE